MLVENAWAILKDRVKAAEPKTKAELAKLIMSVEGHGKGKEVVLEPGLQHP